MTKTNQKIIDDILKKIELDLYYIETNELIEFSGFSYFHFHRIFSAYVGESLKQYLKRIRLEKSAYELQYKNIPITTVALNAGFATPSAFNKAFREFFKTSPSKYKKQNLRDKDFNMIEPKEIIDDMMPIDVYSLRHLGDYNKMGNTFEILMKWAHTYKKNFINKEICAFSFSYDDPNVTEVDKLRSDVCISATDDVELEYGIIRQTIAGGKYAVFLHKGEYRKLKQTYNDIFSSYIKENDAQLRDVPVFVEYLNKDPRRTNPENLRTLIYIPLQ